MSVDDVHEAALVVSARDGSAANAVHLETRSSGIDALRGVAICAVLGLHTSWTLLQHATLHTPGGRVLAVAQLASGFGVPLFLALSSVALSLRHGEAFGSAGAYFAFLTKRAQQLLPAYVLWSLVSCALRDRWLLWPPGKATWMLLTGSADIQLYFVPLLFELYILWPLLQATCRRDAPLRQWPSLACAAVVSFLAMSGRIPALAAPLPYLAIHIVGALWLRRLLLDRPEWRLTAMTLAAALATTALIATARAFFAMLPPPVSPLGLLWASYIFQPLPLLYALAVIALCIAYATRAEPHAGGRVLRALAALGRRSYGIYLTHLVVASNLTWHIVPKDVARAPEALVAIGALAASMFLTLAASLSLTVVLERRRAVAWMVGATSGRRVQAASAAVV